MCNLIAWYTKSDINFIYGTPPFKVKLLSYRVSCTVSINHQNCSSRRQSSVDTVCVTLLDFQMQITHDNIYQELWFVIVVGRKVVWTLHCTKNDHLLPFTWQEEMNGRTKNFTLVYHNHNSRAKFICIL